MLKPYQKAELSFQERRMLAQQGQNSKTFVAHDPQLDAEIVIKQVAKSKLDATEYFEEARILYASIHPNVVQLYYACEDSDCLYLAMPLYAKGSLKELMGGRSITVREIVTMGCQVLSGLHNVHSKRLLHLDIKPDNILLSNRGEALLSDFGLSKRTNGSGVAEQDRFYSRIRPPEGFKGVKLDVRADIYQFGILLYRMCNGKAVYEEQKAEFESAGGTDLARLRFAVINARFPDRSVFLAHVPNRLRSLIVKCLNPDPAERYSTAIEVANALAAVEGNALDWRFSTTASGLRRWEKLVEGRYWEFEVDKDGATTCYKTVNGGRRTRFGEGCKARMTDREIRSFLGAH